MSESRKSFIDARVDRMAGQLQSAETSTGTIAALKRLQPGAPCSFETIAALHRLLPELTTADLDRGWPLVASGLAILGAKQHAPKLCLGTALVAARVTETRLSQLLSARGPSLQSLFLTTCRMLSAKKQPVDFGQLAKLVIYRDAAKADYIRQAIAMDYLQAASRAK